MLNLVRRWKYFLTLVISLFLISLVYLGTRTNAQNAQAPGGTRTFQNAQAPEGTRQLLSSLSPSPLSGGVLTAQAIRSGKLRVPQLARPRAVSPESLTCAPAPCVFPNVQASGGNGGSIANEVPIVVNRNVPSNILTGANDYNCPNIQGFYSSSNGGSTWISTCLNAISGDFGEGDPIVGYDRVNNSYIGGIDAFSGIVFEKSSNNGASWSAPAVAVPVLAFIADKPWMQVDVNLASPHLNCIYISTTQFDIFSDSVITVSHSCDGGATWSSPVFVSTVQVFPTAVQQFSQLAIAKNGTVYATWMQCAPTGPTGDCGGTTAAILYSKSTDGGNTWTIPNFVNAVNLAPDSCGAFYGCLPNTGERTSEVPAVDVDNSSGPHAGTVYVVGYDYRGTTAFNQHMTVEVVRSTNGGTSWSEPVSVAPASLTHDQAFPWLSVSPSGLVGVTWLDRRNDPANFSWEAFSSVSTNGGAGFGLNHQLATVLSSPSNDGFGIVGGFFMGDYTGNYWANNTSLYVSWPDTRNLVDSQDFVGGFLQ